jgi:hypothetical protein
MNRLWRLIVIVVVAVSFCVLDTEPAVSKSRSFGTVKLSVYDAEGERLPPGLKVFVGTRQVAVTDRRQRATLRLPPGRHRIGVLQPRWRGGFDEVDVVSGRTQAIEIKLGSEGLAIVFSRTLRFDQGPILPADLKGLSGAFYEDTGHKAKLTGLQLSFQAGDDGMQLQDALEILPDGGFRTKPGVDLSPLLRLSGKIKLIALGNVKDGSSVWDEELKFFVGRYHVKGRLLPPESEPDLEVSDIVVTAMLSALDEFATPVTIRTAADGSFELSNVPFGAFYIGKQTIAGRQTYAFGGQGFHVASDVTVRVRLRPEAEADEDDNPIELDEP